MDGRRKIKWTLFIGTICLLGGAGLYWLSPFGYRVMGCRVADMGAAERLCTGQELEAGELRLFWNNKELPYDRLTDTYCLPQTMAEEWEGYLSAEARGKYVRLYLLGEAWQEKLAAMGQARPLEFCGVSRAGWLRAAIITTGLPVLRVDTVGQEAENERGEETYLAEGEREGVESPEENEEGQENVMGSLVLYWPSAEQEDMRYIECFTEYHVRGHSSMGYEKKNYTLHLKGEQGEAVDRELLGLCLDDDWKLYGMALDKTLCREKTANDLWNQMSQTDGSPATNHMEYVEYYLNGIYQGIYALAPRLDRKSYGLAEGDILYKFARSIEMWAPYAINTMEGKQVTNWGDRIIILWPKEYRQGIWEPLGTYAGQFVWENGQEASWEIASQIVDIVNMTDTALYKQVVWSMDTPYFNMMYLQRGEHTPLLRVPYDLDWVFGVTVDRYVDEYLIIPDNELNAFFSLDPGYTQQLVTQRWSQLRQRVFSDENLNSHWQENLAYLKQTGGLAHNASRWGYDAAQAEQEVEEIIRAQERRMIFLDEYMQAYQPVGSPEE